MAKSSKKSVKKSVAKKATVSKVAKEKSATPRKTWSDTAKEPKGELMDALIALMRRPNGAGIKDFQEIKGFNLPSMAVVRAAERRGYKATATKKPGERTVYRATGSAK